jgi:hypothetical protein
MSFVVLAGCVAFWRGMAPESADFGRVLLLVGSVSALGAAATCVFPYALLLQGQPFRALWLLKLMQAPAGFYLARQLWQTYPRCGPYLALALLGYFGVTVPVLLDLMLPLCFVAIMFLVGSARAWPTRQSFAVGLVVGLIACSVYRVILMVFLREELLPSVGVGDYLHVLLENIGPAAWLAVMLMVLVTLPGCGCLRPAFAVPAVVVFLTVQTTSFGLRAHQVHQRPDLEFVESFLAGRHAQDHRSGDKAMPTVYWPLGRVKDIWIEVGAKCYFEHLQLSGVIFQSATAAEGQRRARLVAAFEMERLRPLQGFLAPHQRRSLPRLFARDFVTSPPQVHDLVRLCQDEVLDYVVLPQNLASLSCASNGSVFIYDCKHVRRLLAEQANALSARQGLLSGTGER